MRARELRPGSLIEVGAMPNIRLQVRVKCAESAKLVAYAASVQGTPEYPNASARLSLAHNT